MFNRKDQRQEKEDEKSIAGRLERLRMGWKLEKGNERTDKLGA